MPYISTVIANSPFGEYYLFALSKMLSEEIMRKLTVIILIVLIFVVSGSFPMGISTHSGEYDYLSENVIRLHILADGDDDISQEIKLKVRDFILEEYSGRMEFTSREDAENKIKLLSDDIKKDVDGFLRDNGFSYGCGVSLSESIFPDRTYGSILFPAGEYTALKITLGSGEGKNWWCVMYPPLCFAKAYDDENIPDDEVEVRWRFMEWWEEIMGEKLP